MKLNLKLLSISNPTFAQLYDSCCDIIIKGVVLQNSATSLLMAVR